MADGFSERYGDLLRGSYDCVDRVVLNAYYPLGHTPGGFRTWWRRWHGGSDDTLDNEHLMRMAGRFARRVRGWAKANRVDVVNCDAGERKHRIAEEYLAGGDVGTGVFLILVARAPATVWDVVRSKKGGHIGNLKKKASNNSVGDSGEVRLHVCQHPEPHEDHRGQTDAGHAVTSGVAHDGPS